jgi:hypothetical protein
MGSNNKKEFDYSAEAIEEVLNSILNDMGGVFNIKSDDIPNIDLYMDQVLSFLDEKLEYTQRTERDSEERVFTKTMINNYAKNDLLPPPVKKKYSKNHIMTLIFIYYFKNFLSINDVRTLIGPITDKYFGNEDNNGLDSVYDGILELGEERIGHLKEDILDKYKASKEAYDGDDSDSEYLKLFMFMSLLSYDVFIKKMLIEQIVDELRNLEGDAESSNKKEKSNKKK